MIIFDFDNTLADSSELKFADYCCAELVKGLKPTRFASEAIEMLKDEDGMIVTARHSAQAEAIADWTEDNLGKRLTIVTVADLELQEMGKRGKMIKAKTHTKKAHIIRDMDNVSRFYDDKVENVEAIKALGIESILVD